MSRLPRFALYGLAALIGLIALLAVALFLLIDTDVYKTRLEKLAPQALGMELSIAGRPGIDLFPGLVLTLEDVKVRRQGVQLGAARQVTVGIELLSPLGQDLRIGKIALNQPVLTITRGSDGRSGAGSCTGMARRLAHGRHHRLRRQALRQGLRGA
jgi:uncharacterized protein involved in outer membrane biogenesis